MKKANVFYYSFLICLLFWFNFSAQATDISLPLQEEELVVEAYEYLEDPTNLIEVSELINASHSFQFKESSKDDDDFNSEIKTYWLRFHVINSGDFDNEWLFEFDTWSEVDFYVVDERGGVKNKLQTGHLVPFKERSYPVGNKNYISLDIKSGDTVSCYVRLHSIPDHTIFPTDHRFKTGLRSYFDKENRKVESILGLFEGILLIMFFYHLFVLASTRNIAYFYYLAIVGITVYMTLNNSGYVVEVFQVFSSFPQWRGFYESIFSSLTAIMMVFFTIEILNLKKNMPIWFKVFRWWIGLLVLFAILSNVDFELFIPIIYFFSFLLTLAFMIVGVLAVIKKLPSGIHYLIAYSFSVAGLLFLSLTVAGVLPKTNFGLHFSMPLGYTFEILFFSLALANVINLLKKENSQKQEKIISQLQENQELQTKVNRELEQKVEERTLEIKKQKDIAEQAQLRAERSEHVKEQFLANMSHEIRTPMHAISGMVKILERNDHYPEQKVFLNAMHKSSDNLVVLLNDILDLSKIEAGKLEIEQMLIEPRDVIKNVYQILQYKAEEKALELDYSIEESVPKWVLGDPTRLNQVLTNLTGNAIKFTEKGSVHIKLTKKDSSLVYEIQDTGIGIPEDKLQLIFNAFEQAEDSTARRFGGTGLGLNISRQLVEAQAGKIWVESELGKGSSFFVSLPMEEAEGDVLSKQNLSEEQLLELGASMKDKHILLAEDNEFNQMIADDDLKYYLNNVSIDIVENGLDAVEKAKSGKYDVVLMDVQMPEMTGLEASQTIRQWEKEHGKPRLRIIAMTASLLKEEISHCFKAGMDNYIPKPYKAEELLGTLYEEFNKQA